MEVGQAVLALNLVYSQLNLAESVVLILLQIGERDLDNPALEGIVRVLQTSRSVDQGLANTVKSIVRYEQLKTHIIYRQVVSRLCFGRW